MQAFGVEVPVGVAAGQGEVCGDVVGEPAGTYGIAQRFAQHDVRAGDRGVLERATSMSALV